MHRTRLESMAEKTSNTHPNADAFPAGVSGPALRALARARVRSMNELAKRTEAELMELHGIGPKALRTLKDALAKRGRRLRAD